MRAVILGLAIAAGCGGPPAAPGGDLPRNTGSGSAATQRASRWAMRCKEAMIAARDAAATIEPELATMPVEVEARPDREQISASAFPPVWHVAPIHVFVTRPGEPARDGPGWHTYANFERLGSDHRTATRVAGDISIAILADGWDPAQADAIIAAIEPRLEPCFAGQ